MERRLGQTAIAAMMLLLLAACGGSSGGTTEKTATARAADANDAATVTAFAGGRASGAGTSGVAPASGTRVAGKSGGFIFATLPPGGAAGNGQAAAGTPRGATANAGATPAGSAASRSGTPAGVSGNKFTDPKGKYTLTIPQGWKVQSTNGVDIDFEAVPSGLKGAFQIAAEDVGTGVTLDDYATGTMASIKSGLTNYQPVQGGIQEATISGQPARRFDFSGQDGPTSLRAAVYVVKNGTTAYGFLIAAAPEDFDSVFAQAKQFIDTFAFLP